MRLPFKTFELAARLERGSGRKRQPDLLRIPARSPASWLRWPAPRASRRTPYRGRSYVLFGIDWFSGDFGFWPVMLGVGGHMMTAMMLGVVGVALLVAVFRCASIADRRGAAGGCVRPDARGCDHPPGRAFDPEVNTLYTSHPRVELVGLARGVRDDARAEAT